MRVTFINTLADIAEQNSRVMLLTADIGYMVVEAFIERCPNQFINVGVAEQNMVGLATGLAEAGFIPFVYSIAPFAALRPYEFIRNGPIMHQLPVRVVAVGAGMDYTSNGLTHYALEDIGVMRAQPGLTVIGPADHQQARTALLASWNIPGPVYYRLGKDDKLIIPNLNGEFALERLQTIRTGVDVLFLTTGSITAEALQAANELSSLGIECSIAVVASLQPAPTDDLVSLLSQFSAAITLEAHYVNGGLGSIVAEVIAERALTCRLIRCGVQKVPGGYVGDLRYMYESYGISSSVLVQHVIRLLQPNSQVAG